MITLARSWPAGGVDGAPPVDPDEARRAADEILRDGAYAEPTQSLLDRALEWLFEQLGSVFGTLPGGGPGSGIAWVVVAVLGAVAVWFMVRALRAPKLARRDQTDGLEYGTETARDAQAWLDEAARLADAGEYRGALRCRHQALVARLVSDGIVPDVVGRTAGEHARSAAEALPSHEPQLRRITGRFDEVWYADAAVDRAGFASFVEDCASVEASAAEARRSVVST